MPRTVLPFIFLAFGMLAGCDLLGESDEQYAARRDADGRAIGSACRHAGRAIEDCYLLNKRADKAAVFAGWREMNDYMRENKIEPVVPELATQAARAKLAGTGEGKSDGESESDHGTAKPASKAH